MAAHSSTLAWKTPMDRQSMGSQRVGHDWATSLSLSLVLTSYSTLSIKETGIQTHIRSYAGALACHLLGRLAFQIKLYSLLQQKKKEKHSVQSLSRVRLFATPWTAARQASLSITNCQSPPKPMSIESVMSSNHLIFCRPLLLLPSIFSSIRVFSNESALLISWPKYQSFSFSISPSNEYSGLISFRMDWFDLLAAQGTLKSLLQQHSSKHQFFGTQLSL